MDSSDAGNSYCQTNETVSWGGDEMQSEMYYCGSIKKKYEY